MAEINLKKLSRAELLEMMIQYSEEAEAAKEHERLYKEELEREKAQMQHEMAEERARMLAAFDEEKAQMRAKFGEQKAEQKAKFDKDIAGLKARLTREKEEMQQQVDDALMKIENSQSLAEASIKLGGIMESAQKAADLYLETLKKSAQKEYQQLMQEIQETRAKLQAGTLLDEGMETEELKAEVEETDVKEKKTTKTTAKKTTTRKTATKKEKESEEDTEEKPKVARKRRTTKKETE
ncbi:hypothetical protein [Butyrivibrio sp.]|jgi:hypothetical protein|uniref:hypothetical protein n=1 Tax=Butyrivibrio sp. TaxID=28121 RepID=UPI0025C4E24A|nr:hypothetical protein [Butyrivibrio sp.]